jgi:hypothetical protein
MQVVWEGLPRGQDIRAAQIELVRHATDRLVAGVPSWQVSGLARP